MPDQSEAPIVRPHLDDILRDWTDGTMDAAGTIEDLVERVEEAAEIIRLCEEALETAIGLLWEHSEGLGPRIEPLETALAQIKGQNP